MGPRKSPIVFSINFCKSTSKGFIKKHSAEELFFSIYSTISEANVQANHSSLMSSEASRLAFIQLYFCLDELGTSPSAVVKIGRAGRFRISIGEPPPSSTSKKLPDQKAELSSKHVATVPFRDLFTPILIPLRASSQWILCQ